MNLLDGTSKFHHLADLPTGESIVDGMGRNFSNGQPMTDQGFTDLRKLRIKLLAEEFKEYLDGEAATVEDGETILWDDQNLPEVVDGLLDIIVIAWGSLLAYVGEDKAIAAANEVVRSNLSKVDGTLGPIVRREDGKLMKPEGWTGPNIEGVLFSEGA